MIDYHTHTTLCKHASGSMEEYVDAAIGKGLVEIGISCHNPMPDGYDPRHRMTMEEFKEIYKPGVLALRKKYESAITIKFGVEIDFYPGTESYVRRFIEENDFDYVIGSVHYLGSWPEGDLIPVFNFDPAIAHERYTEYYERIRHLAESGLCDIIAHFDLVKKNGVRPQTDHPPLRDTLRRTLHSIKENQLSVEINTSGLRKKVHEIYPSEEILSLLNEFEIPLTTGSDAHKPADVAADFDIAYSLIDTYANGKVATYTKRTREDTPIAEFSTYHNNTDNKEENS